MRPTVSETDDRLEFEYEGRTLPQWIALLQDVDPTQRLEAMTALYIIGSHARAALPHLIRALNDCNPMIRERAAWALGQFGENAKPAIPVLIEKLEDQAEQVRASAQIALRRLQNDVQIVLPELLEALNCSSSAKQIAVTEMLALFKELNQEAVNRLIELLPHDDYNVREAAAQALCQIKIRQPSLLSGIIEGSEKWPLNVRIYAAAYNWQSQREQSAIFPFLELALASDQKDIRALGARIVCDIGEGAKELEGDILSLLQDSDFRVRIQAVRALWHLKVERKKAVSLLKQMEQDVSIFVRPFVRKMLENFGEEKEPR